LKNILLLLSNGFEILEASAFIDVMGWNFEEGDKSTKLFTCGLRKQINSSFNHQFTVDCLVKELDVNSFDALAIPGGFKKYNYYEDAFNEEFLSLIREFRSKNKIIASICVGALPMAKSGILNNKSGTTYNSEEYRKELVNYGVNLLDNPIVIDNNLITSNGPSTAVDVAFLLLEALTSKENKLKVRNLMGF
jgi:4-methyl-5(b-hydroxyethyl)-thiazole monophosphate biosynthesis